MYMSIGHARGYLGLEATRMAWLSRDASRRVDSLVVYLDI
jgi:hypothetical protein